MFVQHEQATCTSTYRTDPLLRDYTTPAGSANVPRATATSLELRSKPQFSAAAQPPHHPAMGGHCISPANVPGRSAAELELLYNQLLRMQAGFGAVSKLMRWRRRKRKQGGSGGRVVADDERTD